jgi:hypothetical protein
MSNNLKLFFPEEKEIKDISELDDLLNFNTMPLRAFDEKIIDFCENLSKHLLKNKSIRQYPELAAFAFWIRKSNIKKFLSTLSQNDVIIYTPRGLVFHIAPSNVDYMFLYSWFISILAGNTNVLRISSNYDENIIRTIQMLIKFAERNNVEWFLKSNIIINYKHNDEINNCLSSKADARIFWGGDETIKKMRKFDSKPNVKDVYFANKFSYAIIKSNYYLSSTKKENNFLASNFYNDSYLFNQKACSSPQVVFFVGDEKSNKHASNVFWKHLTLEVEARVYKKSSSVILEHYLNWYLLAAKCKVNKYEINTTKPTVVSIPYKDIPDTYRTCGGGFFIESYVESLNQLLNFGNESDQTLSYYGFDQADLKNYVIKKGYKSNLRLVPIGRALDFDVYWDGYNLLNELVKIITVY